LAATSDCSGAGTDDGTDDDDGDSGEASAGDGGGGGGDVAPAKTASDLTRGYARQSSEAAGVATSTCHDAHMARAAASAL